MGEGMMLLLTLFPPFFQPHSQNDWPFIFPDVLSRMSHKWGEMETSHSNFSTRAIKRLVKMKKEILTGGCVAIVPRPFPMETSGIASSVECLSDAVVLGTALRFCYPSKTVGPHDTTQETKHQHFGLHQKYKIIYNLMEISRFFSSFLSPFLNLMPQILWECKYAECHSFAYYCAFV